MRKTLVVLGIMGFSFLSSPFSFAGDYEAAIDAQSEAMNQTMRSFSTIQGHIAAYWRNMPEREKHINRTVNSAVYNFEQQTGRYPTDRDTDFIRGVLNEAGVQNQTEAEYVLHRLAQSIETSKKMDDLHNKIWGIK